MAITKVTTDVITDLAVTAPKLAADSVITAKIADNAVTAAKIAAGALGDQVAGITSSASATTIAGTLTSTGTITVGDGHTMGDDGDDNFVLTGSAGENVIIDSAVNIILDADVGEVQFKDAGTEIGVVSMLNQNMNIESKVADKDILFKGIDGSSDVTALTLDMSDAGKATFNSGVVAGGTVQAQIAGFFLTENTTNAFSIASNGANGFLKIRDEYNSADRLTILNNGNVGIGTTAPGDFLHITNGDNAVDTRIRLQAFGQLPIWHTYYAAGTESSPTAPTSGTELSRFAVSTWDGNDYSQSAGQIRIVAEANHSSNVAPAYMAFDTNSTTRLATEKMRITASGNLGIGTDAPHEKVHVLGASGVSLLMHMDADTADGTSAVLFKNDSTNDDRRIKAGIIYQRDDPGTRGTGDLHLCVNKVNSDTNVSVSDARISILTGGEVKMPSQPCFSAALPAATTSGSMIVFGGEHLDVGNHYNASDGKFTAPVAGNYYFSFWILMDPSGANHYSRVLFSVNGSSSTQWTDNLENASREAQGDYHSVGGAAIIPLAANDYVQLYNSGQSPTYGTAYGNWSGFLVS